MAVYLIRQQSFSMLTYIIHAGAIISSLETARGISQYFIGPTAVAQVLETDAILPPRQEIFCHSQHEVIMADV